MSEVLHSIPYDWFPSGIPANVELRENAYVDTSYGFAAFHSEQTPGLTLGYAAGAYNRATFVVGPQGRINVGDFSILNESYLICQERIEIGAHCLLSWGVVLTDCWSPDAIPIAARRIAMHAAAADPRRLPPAPGATLPIVLEDNVWVGFDSVIMPGVRLGRGSVVGCKTVVNTNVPPYAVIVGSPARIVRYLEPDDTNEARGAALRTCVRDHI